MRIELGDIDRHGEYEADLGVSAQTFFPFVSPRADLRTAERRDFRSRYAETTDQVSSGDVKSSLYKATASMDPWSLYLAEESGLEVNEEWSG